MKILSILNEGNLNEAESLGQLTPAETEYDKLGQSLEAGASADPRLLNDPKYKAKLEKYRAWKQSKAQGSAGGATAGVKPISGADTSVPLSVDQLKAAMSFNSAVKPEVITQVQKILEHLKIQPVGKPGVNDEKFVYALANFQKKAGLPVNGKYTTQTKDALGKEITLNPMPKTDPTKDPSKEPAKEPAKEPDTQIATSEEFNKLPGEVFTHPGSSIQYKIVKTMPYRNDNDVTMVLLAQHLEGLVFFFIFGLDPVNRREFMPDASTDKIKTDLKKMERLFTSEYRLKGPYLYGPNTLPDTIGKRISK